MQFRANSKDNLDARCNIINLGIRVWSSSLPSLLLEGVRRRGGGITEKCRLWMVSLIPFRRVDVERCLKKWNSGKTKDPAIRNSKFYFNCKVPQTSLFKLGGEKGCDQNNRHFVPPSRSELLSWKCSLTIKSNSLSSVVASVIVASPCFRLCLPRTATSKDMPEVRHQWNWLQSPITAMASPPCQLSTFNANSLRNHSLMKAWPQQQRDRYWTLETLKTFA